jgi:hypothetical protein
MEWSKYWQLVADYREMELTASLEREAELRAEVERLRGKPFSDRMYAALESRLAAAQNAALTRENEQSAIDAATVEERFELRERLRFYEEPVDKNGFSEDDITAIRAELAKEKANG